jgi:hypothetical protein
VQASSVTSVWGANAGDTCGVADVAADAAVVDVVHLIDADTVARRQADIAGARALSTAAARCSIWIARRAHVAARTAVVRVTLLVHADAIALRVADVAATSALTAATRCRRVRIGGRTRASARAAVVRVARLVRAKATCGETGIARRHALARDAGHRGVGIGSGAGVTAAAAVVDVGGRIDARVAARRQLCGHARRYLRFELDRGLVNRWDVAVTDREINYVPRVYREARRERL